jgi:hypothetical protein
MNTIVFTILACGVVLLVCLGLFALFRRFSTNINTMYATPSGTSLSDGYAQYRQLRLVLAEVGIAIGGVLTCAAVILYPDIFMKQVGLSVRG